MTKLSQKKLQNTTINLPSYICSAHTVIRLASFSFILLNCCQFYKQRRVRIVSMFHFVESDKREQQKYENRSAL